MLESREVDIRDISQGSSNTLFKQFLHHSDLCQMPRPLSRFYSFNLVQELQERKKKCLESIIQSYAFCYHNEKSEYSEYQTCKSFQDLLLSFVLDFRFSVPLNGVQLSQELNNSLRTGTDFQD